MATHRVHTLAVRSLIAHLLVLTLAACGGGSGGGGSGSGGTGSSGSGGGSLDNSFVPHAAVELDNQTGTLPAGSIVPLACVDGGVVMDAHLPFCDVRHLHQTIDIAGVGSGFADPASGNCGHGRVATFSTALLDHSCAALEEARLSVIVDDLTRYSSLFAALLESDGTELVFDLGTGLFAGANPIEASRNTDYVRAALFASCDLGMNPGSGEREVLHNKYIIDLEVGVQRYVKFRCSPYAATTNVDLDVELANTEYTGGEFFTGRRGTSSISLTAGITNQLSFDVDSVEEEKSGLVIGFKATGWDALAFTYDTDNPDTIQANAGTLETMADAEIGDAAYLGTDYQGLRIYAKAPGLYQDYYALDGTTSTDRSVPVVGNLGAIGGIHKLQARFEATEPGTGRTQTARISRYALIAGARVDYSLSPPPYFTAGDYTTTDSADGFYLGTTYSLGSSTLTPVEFSIRAETFDAGSNTRHKWRVDNLTADLSGTYATWPDEYVNATGTNGLLPGGDDITRLRYAASSDATATRRHELYEDTPLDELDDVLSVGVSYRF